MNEDISMTKQGDNTDENVDPTSRPTYSNHK